MQKYKKGHDQSALAKPTKHPQVPSVNSNKSLLKFSTNTQNKSSTSVQNHNDAQTHTKSLHQKNKSSKHLQSHTFATNTHQNSISLPFQSTSHNNSKSNKKGSNNGKKSNGKKVKYPEGSKETMHGRSASQYENLSFVVKDVRDKGEVAKGYKNVLKARKEQREANQSILNYGNNNKKQTKEALINGQPSNSIKPRNPTKIFQTVLTKKSINISSHKQLSKPGRQQSKSHSKSKSKQLTKLSKKSQNSRRHLLTEISHTVTAKENNINQGNTKSINQGNSKSVTRRNEGNSQNNMVNKLSQGHKKRTVSSTSQLPSNQMLGFQSRQNNTRQPRHKATLIQQYQKIPTHIFKSSTNSEIQYSNMDQNTVNYKNKKIGSGLISHEPFFYNQDEDILFCGGDSDDGEQLQKITEGLHNYEKKSMKINIDERKNTQINQEIQSRKMGKRGKSGLRMNLQLSSQCFNCLTEPDYLIQPKGIRHLTTAQPYQQQPYSMKSSKPKSSSCSRPLYSPLNPHSYPRKNIIKPTQQLLKKSAIKIQKVWRGYMTRKLLAMYIEAEEIKLEKRMIQLGRDNSNLQQVRRNQAGEKSAINFNVQKGQKKNQAKQKELDQIDNKNSLNPVCLIDDQSYCNEQEWQQQQLQQNDQPNHKNYTINRNNYTNNSLDQSSIPANPYAFTQHQHQGQSSYNYKQSLQNEEQSSQNQQQSSSFHNQSLNPPILIAQAQINNSVNALDYESQILPRQEQQTISFLGEINNINLGGYSLIQNDLENNQIAVHKGQDRRRIDQIMYTSVESVERVDNLFISVREEDVMPYDQSNLVDKESNLINESHQEQESRDEFGDKLVQQIAGYQRRQSVQNHDGSDNNNEKYNKSSSYSAYYEESLKQINQSSQIDKNQSYQIDSNQSYQIQNTLTSNHIKEMIEPSPSLFQVNESYESSYDQSSQSYQQPPQSSHQQPSQLSQQQPSQLSHQQASHYYHQQQSSYQDPTTIIIGRHNKINNPKQSVIPVKQFSSQSNKNHKFSMMNYESSYVDERQQVSSMINDVSSYVDGSQKMRVGRQDDDSYAIQQGQEEGNNKKTQQDENNYYTNKNNYRSGSLQIPQKSLKIHKNSPKLGVDEKIINMTENSDLLHKHRYIAALQQPKQLWSQANSSTQTETQQKKQQKQQNISKSYFQHFFLDQTSRGNNQQSQKISQSLNKKDLQQQCKGKKPQFQKVQQQFQKGEPYFRKDEELNQKVREWPIESSYHLKQEQKLKQEDPDYKLLIGANHQIESSVANNYPQISINRHTYTSKSNPNILILKSPKNHFTHKPSFSFSVHQDNKNNNLSNQINHSSASYQKIPPNSQTTTQPIKKSSSLKQLFMKKSFFNDTSNPLSQNDHLPIPNFAHSNINYIPYPTQKQATSIQSLLHFRHQCLTHHHSAQFHLLQSKYVRQQITKQQFISKLQLLASRFELSATSIKQTQKDIFNGYKALLKLIKDVVKDCKTLGLGNENRVRFCRSMELFIGEKSLLKSRRSSQECVFRQQDCVFGDEYLWRFDEVMIDEMEKSKREKSSIQKSSINKDKSSVKKVQVIDEERNSQVQNGLKFQDLQSNDQPDSKKDVPHIQQSLVFGQSQSSNSSSKFSRSNPRPMPLSIQSRPQLRPLAVSSSSSQKQLSRQSSSHHHLPQLILQPRDISPDKPLSISRNSLKLSHDKDQLLKVSDDKDQQMISHVQKSIQNQLLPQGYQIIIDNQQKLYQPCSFDISQLGECEDEYIDDDEDDQEEESNNVKKQQKRLITSSKHSNQSSSYDIDDQSQREQQSFCDQAQQKQFQQNNNRTNKYRHASIQPHAKKYQQQQPEQISPNKQSISNSPKQFVRSFQISHAQLNTLAQHYSSSPKIIIPGTSPLKLNLNQQSFGSYEKISQIIRMKNKEFSQIEHAREDLLDNRYFEAEKGQQNGLIVKTQKQQQVQSDDSLDPLPLIKREVYQLSIDSDSDQQEQQQDQTIPKGIPKKQFHLIHANKQVECIDGRKYSLPKQRVINRQDLLKRAESFDCTEEYKKHKQTKNLSAKYTTIAEWIQIFAIWQFIQQLTLNKAKHHNTKQTTMGKRLGDYAKTYNQNVQQLMNLPQSFAPNDSQQEINSNVVIITNSSNKYLKGGSDRSCKHVINKRKQPLQRQNTGRIREDEVRGFLHMMYREMPEYDQSQGKLAQRMYPSPLQLLKSLRDTHMDNYFNQTNNYHQQKLSNSSQESDINNHSKSPSSKHIDSQTSYLQLGSYEFLLSQEMCETIIEKYITEEYEPQCQMRKQMVQQRGQRQWLSVIKRQFNQYIEAKIMLKGYKNNQTNSKPTNEFQTLIRTRHLFQQHKQLQAEMLRKEILKIQLHTILDSMNQQLIKQRQSKTGYSGIGLNELGLGLVERTGLQVCNQQEYTLLVNRAKFRLQKFVLNNQVDVGDKLILECQQSVTMNDSQWVFYVTEALQFGLEISKIFEEILWDQATRELARIMLKRRFTLGDNSQIILRGSTKINSNNNQNNNNQNDNNLNNNNLNDSNHNNNKDSLNVDHLMPRSRKVLNINIVVPEQQAYNTNKTTHEVLMNESQSQLFHNQFLNHNTQLVLNDNLEINHSPLNHLPKPYQPQQINPQMQQPNQNSQQLWQINSSGSFLSNQGPFDISSHSYNDLDEPSATKIIPQPQQITQNPALFLPAQIQEDNDSYQLDDDELEFNEDQQLEKELQNMHSDQDDQQEMQTQVPLNDDQQLD